MLGFLGGGSGATAIGGILGAAVVVGGLGWFVSDQRSRGAEVQAAATHEKTERVVTTLEERYEEIDTNPVDPAVSDSLQHGSFAVAPGSDRFPFVSGSDFDPENPAIRGGGHPDLDAGDGTRETRDAGDVSGAGEAGPGQDARMQPNHQGIVAYGLASLQSAQTAFGDRTAKIMFIAGAGSLLLLLIGLISLPSEDWIKRKGGNVLTGINKVGRYLVYLIVALVIGVLVAWAVGWI